MQTEACQLAPFDESTLCMILAKYETTEGSLNLMKQGTWER